MTLRWRTAIGLSIAAFVLVYGLAWLWQAGQRRSRQVAAARAQDRIDEAQPQQAAARKQRLTRLIESGQRVTPARRLPRFVTAVLSPIHPAPFQQMLDQHPATARPLLDRIKQSRVSDHVAVDLCAWDFLQRHPEQKQLGFRGNLAVKLAVEGGRGRVVELLPVEGADDTFVRCYAGASSWVAGTFETAEADFEGVYDWPYSFGPLADS